MLLVQYFYHFPKTLIKFCILHVYLSDETQVSVNNSYLSWYTRQKVD